jgi:thiol-disulfide isomerase/thioredoxin
MKNRTVINYLGFGFLVIAMTASVLFAQTKQAPSKQAVKPLPNLVLDTLDGGKKWSLHENRGRVVLINFWATWCEPCLKEVPMLISFGKEYEKRGLRIVGIALDEEHREELIKSFVGKYKINYPILLPVIGSRLAQIDPVPTTLLIDAEGRLAKKYVGLIPEKLLRADIEKLTKTFRDTNRKAKSGDK